MSEREPDKPPRKHRVKLSRDLVLFTVGLLGVTHETLLEHGERPSLLILFAACLGLPLYLRKNGW